MANNTEQKNPFTRPGFVVSAVILGTIVVIAIVLIIVNNTKDSDPSTPPISQTSATPSTSSPTDREGGLCGLDKVKLSGTLDAAPEAEWRHIGTNTFPTSLTSGPRNQTAAGVLTCFERTPAGVVFAAASSAVQGSDPEVAADWLDYILVESPEKDLMVEEARSSTADSGSTRMTVMGFKLLSYDGDTARVDLLVRGDGKGKSVYIAMVYTFKWVNGDWRLYLGDSQTPGEVAQVPSPAGYVTWKE